MVASKFPLPILAYDRSHYEDLIRGRPDAIAQLVETRPEYAIRIVTTFGDEDVARAFVARYSSDPGYWNTALDFSRDLKQDKLVEMRRSA